MILILLLINGISLFSILAVIFCLSLKLAPVPGKLPIVPSAKGRANYLFSIVINFFMLLNIYYYIILSFTSALLHLWHDLLRCCLFH